MPDLELSNFECLALDFDGTLADSQGTHMTARLMAFDELAADTKDERFSLVEDAIHKEAQRHGHRSVEIIGWVLQQAGITTEVITDLAKEVAEIKKELYWNLAKAGLPEVEGAADFVRLAHGHLPDLAIVTSGYRDTEVLPYLEKYDLTDFFDERDLITREDTGEITKPHPRPYLQLILRQAILPDELLAVEDSPRGIESANMAGAVVVGLANTHTREELERGQGVQKPYAVADSFLHLGKLIHIA